MQICTGRQICLMYAKMSKRWNEQTNHYLNSIHFFFVFVLRQKQKKLLLLYSNTAKTTKNIINLFKSWCTSIASYVGARKEKLLVDHCEARTMAHKIAASQHSTPGTYYSSTKEQIRFRCKFTIARGANYRANLNCRGKILVLSQEMSVCIACIHFLDAPRFKKV